MDKKQLAGFVLSVLLAFSIFGAFVYYKSLENQTFVQGMAALHFGDYDVSKEKFNEILKRNPNHIDAVINRGIASLEMKDYGSALVDFNLALEKMERYDLYYNRGKTYFSLQKYILALQDAGKAIELKPDDAPSYNLKGAVYFALKDYERSSVAFTRAIELDPESAKYYFNRAKAYQGLGDFERTADDFEKANELDPELLQAAQDF